MTNRLCFKIHFTLRSSLSNIVRWQLRSKVKAENAKTLVWKIFQNLRLSWLLYLHADRLRDWLAWSTLFHLLLCWLILKTKSSWRQENSSSIRLKEDYSSHFYWYTRSFNSGFQRKVHCSQFFRFSLRRQEESYQADNMEIGQVHSA